MYIRLLTARRVIKFINNQLSQTQNILLKFPEKTNLSFHFNKVKVQFGQINIFPRYTVRFQMPL